MTDNISAFFERLTQLYLEERFDEIIRLVAPPLPIYTPAGIKVTITEQDLRNTLSEVIGSARAAGMERLMQEVVCMRESGQAGSFVATVRWTYFDREDTPISSSEAECYLDRDEANQLRIRMLDYKKIAFPSKQIRRLKAPVISRSMH